ncbi:MAG: GatB/YqeY domain-containing protein [Chloroflexi bacterium]|nr:GatB/YqeY domain-containing protein [Chloroflexota bacterium]
MDTRQKIETALKEAMRSGDNIRKQNLRMIMSSLKLSEVEKGGALDEAGVLSVIQKELKSRQEALHEAQTANRPDLIERARADIAVIEEFLPKQLTEEELTTVVTETITEVGASGPRDMGKVMKAVMAKVQGRAAGDQVSQIVRKKLQA